MKFDKVFFYARMVRQPSILFLLWPYSVVDETERTDPKILYNTQQVQSIALRIGQQCHMMSINH